MNVISKIQKIDIQLNDIINKHQTDIIFIKQEYTGLTTEIEEINKQNYSMKIQNLTDDIAEIKEIKLMKYSSDITQINGKINTLVMNKL